MGTYEKDLRMREIEMLKTLSTMKIDSEQWKAQMKRINAVREQRRESDGQES